MTEEVLKNCTMRTLNFGSDFLSKLSEVALPEELTEMHKHLKSCFFELNKIWENVNKISVKHKKEFKLDELKNQLTELDTTSQTKRLKIQLYKSKSISDLIGANPKETKVFVKSDSDREVTPSPPNSNNSSPVIPPKVKARRFELSTGHDVFAQCYENCRKIDSPVNKNNALKPRISGEVKTSQMKGKTLPKTLPGKLQESKGEDDYLIVEKERKLPGISKFTQLNKMPNVFINRWQLGERYCGISEGVLYIFRKFQDVHAEITMELPKMYVGKDPNEKSVLFQTREIMIELVSSDKDMQERFYQAAFRSQNKYSEASVNTQPNNAPQMPKPYSKKDSEMLYINVSTTIAHKIKRWRPVKNRPERLSSKDENDYIDVNRMDQYVEMNNSRAKTSY